MQFTPEDRNIYPRVIGLIKCKNKPDMLIDQKDIKDLLDAINTNDFVFIDMYNTSLHKFDIEDISVVKVTDEIRTLIKKLSLNRLELQSTKDADVLSLTQSLECLQNKKTLTITE